MPRRGGTPEYLQASLQVLPPDSPSSHTSEPSRLRPPPATGNVAAAHWSINSREKPGLPRKPPTKSVSLKLSSKAAVTNGPTAGCLLGTGITGTSSVRRACSADVAWAEHVPEVPTRQTPTAQKRTQVASADGRSGVGGRVSNSQPLDGTASPLLQVEASQVGGRPPVPTRPSPGKRVAAASRCGGADCSGSLDDDFDDVKDLGRVYAPVVAAPLNSLPRGGRGGATVGRTGGGRGAGFRAGGNGAHARLGGRVPQHVTSAAVVQASTGSGGCGLAALLGGGHAARPPSRPSSSHSWSDVGEAPPCAPRVAWPEGGQGEDLEEEIFDSDVSDMAAQIRRDLLVRRLMDDGDVVDGDRAAASTSPDMSSAEELVVGGADASSVGGCRWVPRTADARAVLEDTERTLKEAELRTKAKRSELQVFLDEIKSRSFEGPKVAPTRGGPASVGGSRSSADSGLPPSTNAGKADAIRPTDPELLVSLPVDFDDLVDLNAQLSMQRHVVAKKSHGSATGGSGPAAARAGVPRRDARRAGALTDAAKDTETTATPSDRLAIPSFLEKYFNEEKALEQLPHKRLEKDELEEERIRLPEEETEMQRGLRQIARLDGMLLKREAEGAARLQSAKVELEAARDKLEQESQRSHEEKIEVLRKLKERGLISGTGSTASSRRTSKCSTVTPYNANSGSTSYRSLSSNDGNESSSQRSPSAALVAMPHNFGETPAVMTDWSGWTSTAVPNGADANGDGLDENEPTRPASACGADGADTTNASDIDTSTFELTSTTMPFAGLRPPQANSASTSTLRRPSSGSATLATVAEDDAGGEGQDTATQLMLEGHVDAVVDDPYAADSDALDALRRIDEQLQQIVPEQEWEAKSICSFPCRVAGSAAGEESAVGSRAVRSVWSRSGGEAAPGDPLLCEQYESRQSELLLVSIDNRLRDVQYSEAVHEVPCTEDIRKLLLQAAQETVAPDAESRVLALTGTAPLHIEDGSSTTNSAEKSSSSLVLATSSTRNYQDGGLMLKAKMILNRLEDADNDWHDAFGEAQSSLIQLEEDLKHLENPRPQSSSAADVSAATALNEKEVSPQGAEQSAVASFVKRLEELGAEAQSVIEKEGPDQAGQELLAKLRHQLANGNADEAALLGVTRDASLQGAANDGDVVFDFQSDFHPGKVNTDGPNLELMKALDIELPCTDGMWETEELERVVTAMNLHYGDVPAPLDQADEGGLTALGEAFEEGDGTDVAAY